MPFGSTQDEIVVINRVIGDTAHAFPYRERQDLIGRLARKEGITINDTRGAHHYPAAAVLGLHFQCTPNHEHATVQLWQDQYGIGRPDQPGAARLYLVDPDTPYYALPLKPSYITPGRFRRLAAAIIQNPADLDEVVDGAARDVEELDQGAHVATWHHKGGRVEIITEQRAGVPGTPPVAGEIAQYFIGSQDMSIGA